MNTLSPIKPNSSSVIINKPKVEFHYKNTPTPLRVNKQNSKDLNISPQIINRHNSDHSIKNQEKKHSCYTCGRQANYKASSSCKHYCTPCAAEQMIKGVEIVEQRNKHNTIIKNQCTTTNPILSPTASNTNQTTNYTKSNTPANNNNGTANNTIPTNNNINNITSHNNSNSTNITTNNIKNPVSNSNSNSNCNSQINNGVINKSGSQNKKREVELEEFIKDVEMQQNKIKIILEQSENAESQIKQKYSKKKCEIQIYYKKIQQAIKASLSADVDILQMLQKQQLCSVSETRHSLSEDLIKLIGIKSDIKPNLKKIVQKVEEPKYCLFMEKYKQQIQRISKCQSGVKTNSNIMISLEDKHQYYDPTFYRITHNEDSTLTNSDGFMSGIYFSFEKKK